MRKIILIGFCSVALMGCGIRKKEITKQLEAVQTKVDLIESHSNSNLVTEVFGDSLKGQFNTRDTSGTDSTTIESNGVKLILKVTGAKPGTTIHYTAVAKPTARSTLSTSNDQKQTVKQDSKVTLDEKSTKTVNTNWVWLVPLLIIGAGVVAFLIKKKLL